ncbi:hypothetical protein ACOME3_000827 [Neoechinorhynchus agilis]
MNLVRTSKTSSIATLRCCRSCAAQKHPEADPEGRSILGSEEALLSDCLEANTEISWTSLLHCGDWYFVLEYCSDLRGDADAMICHKIEAKSGPAKDEIKRDFELVAPGIEMIDHYRHKP